MSHDDFPFHCFGHHVAGVPFAVQFAIMDLTSLGTLLDPEVCDGKVSHSAQALSFDDANRRDCIALDNKIAANQKFFHDSNHAQTFRSRSYYGRQFGLST